MLEDVTKNHRDAKIFKRPVADFAEGQLFEYRDLAIGKNKTLTLNSPNTIIVIKNGSLDATRFAASFASAKQREFEAKIYALTKTRINLDAYVTDDKGRVLFDSTDPAAVGRSLTDRRDVRITLAGGYGARSTRTDDEDDDSSVMYVGAPIRAGSRIVGAVSVSKPQRAVFQFRDETRRWLLWHISMITVCMVLASYLLAGLVCYNRWR